jgi:hypothetical protein
MFSIPALVAKHIGRRVRLKKEEIPGSNPSLVLAVNLYIAVLSSKLKIRCLCVLATFYYFALNFKLFVPFRVFRPVPS